MKPVKPRLALAMTVLAPVVLLTALAVAHAEEGRDLVVRNQTRLTLSVISNENLATERFVPPGTVHTLPGYLPLGRSVLQVQAPCADGAKGFSTEAVWLSREEGDPVLLVVSREDLGLDYAAMDRQGCGVDKDNEMHAQCLDYAALSVRQQVQAEGRKCEIQGEGWSDDYRYHVQRCKDVGLDQVLAEYDARELVLVQCLDGQAGNGFCGEYANTAVAQQEENLARGCGFEGGGWSLEYATHFDLCERSSQDYATKHQGIRQGMLQGCGQ